MSETKKSGLFVNKKPSASSKPLSGEGLPLSKPKNVKQRWILIGAGCVGAVLILSSIFGPQKKERTAPVKKEDSGLISVTPASADKAAFEANYAQKMEAMNKKLQDFEQELKEKDSQIKELKSGTATPPPGITPPPSESNLGALGTSPATPPAPPTPPAAIAPPPVPQANQASLSPTPSTGMPAIASTPALRPSGNGAPLSFKAPGSSSSNTNSAAPETQTGASGGVPSTTRYVKNANAGMLPAGAFAPVALLNGVDAGTSSATQANPLPILLDITSNAVLPGSAKYQLKSCFVLGTAYGDMSAERVYARFSRMSCVDKKNRLILSQDIAGYLVDSDGKLGLRGEVVDRQGAKLGKALLAGFAQGLAGALGQSQSTVLSNLTSGTTTSSISGGNALRASGLAGAQTAASQLAEFYLREAQNIFPVISVEVGRRGTLVFTNSVSLAWNETESKFTAEVAPSNSSR